MIPRFLADEMLGDVVKWLRIMGYEAAYKTGVPDNELINRARAGFILLTSDKQLYSISRKEGIKCILLTEPSTEDKLIRIFSELKLRPSLESTRCTVCGSELEVVKGKRRYPKGRTWICRNCGKIYWKGSHWRNINRMIRSIKERLSENEPTRNQMFFS